MRPVDEPRADGLVGFECGECGKTAWVPPMLTPDPAGPTVVKPADGECDACGASHGTPTLAVHAGPFDDAELEAAAEADWLAFQRANPKLTPDHLAEAKARMGDIMSAPRGSRWYLCADCGAPFKGSKKWEEVKEAAA